MPTPPCNNARLRSGAYYANSAKAGRMGRGLERDIQSMMISLDQIAAARDRIAPYISRTPTIEARFGFFKDMLSASRVFLKYELFQISGTFKARGVLNNLLSGDPKDGVTAASAGNHAIAVAVASKILGLNAKVVMQSTANPARIAAAKNAGAEVIIVKDGKEAFARALEIADKEGRTFVHPFDGVRVAEATAGVSAELLEDAGGLDAIVVAVGGGGLAGGVCAGAKLIDPDCETFGVEPDGAAAMTQSFTDGAPATLTELDTIADSLAPPMTTETTFSLCRDHMDHLATISDDHMAAAAFLLFRDCKLAVEPGGAASTAAALSVFAEQLAGKRIGVILCGSNIDPEGFLVLLNRGEQALGSNILNP